MKQVLATIIHNSVLTPEPHYSHGREILRNHLIRLACGEITQEAKPGQFVMVRCGDDCFLPRPFSIHQISNDAIDLFFGVWKDGKGTLWLSQRKVGEKIYIFGPLGHGYSIRLDSKNLLLAAGGIGVAPLRFLAQYALEQGYAVKLLLGASTAAQLYPAHFFPSKIEFTTTTEDGSAGKMGTITDFLSEFTVWADQIFACGPVGMYQTMAQMPELKNKRVQVSLEMAMACGMGVCYSCTIKTKSGLKQVCRDGPVFNLEDIIWEEVKGV
jgi:dihydroorotate dehydrogenase electron transfer subunit